MSESTPAVKFTITTQVHQQVPTANGQLTGQWRVGFTTPSGVESFVMVPDAEYNAAQVHSMVAARVATIESVQALNGTPPEA